MSFDPSVVVAALKKDGLYGAPYTPEGWVPTLDLGVSYPTSGAVVSLGNELTPKEAAPDPTIAFTAVRLTFSLSPRSLALIFDFFYAGRNLGLRIR